MCKKTLMVNWNIVYTKQAQGDAKKLKSAGLKEKALGILEILEKNPFQNPPPYEKLVGDLKGSYSRRINIQHRIVYQVYENIKTVKVIRIWTHYK
ncbi:MAG: Txe/YoeB family addiction module toxin [Ignavibacteriaceae bacterium]